MAAEAEGTFRGAAGPDRAQINADGGKNWDVENCQDALRQLLRLFKLEGNTAKPEIEDAGATAALVADNRVGVGSDHGNAFGFALNREGSIRNRGGILLGEGSPGHWGSSREIG